MERNLLNQRSESEIYEIAFLSIYKIREAIPETQEEMKLLKEIKIKDNVRGHAIKSQGLIVLPSWLRRKEIEYIEYYVAHELAHIVAPLGSGHNRTFKFLEALFCGVLGVALDFGPRQRGRKRAYPKRVVRKEVK